MGRDLALLIPEIVVLLTAVGALVAEMLRRPRIALAVAVIGLLADRTSQEALGWVSLVVVLMMAAMWAAVRANAPTGSATPAS